MTEARQTRRRRSVARTPALVDPADIPDDAPGRVALIAVRAPDDELDPGPAADPASAGPPAVAARLAGLMTAFDGWLVVALIAAFVLVVFVVGMVLTR